MDIYAGATMYVGSVLAVKYVANTVRHLTRDPTALSAEPAAPMAVPNLPSVQRLPRDTLGWTANCLSSALVCGLHGLQGYAYNTTIHNNQGLRLLTGTLIGAGLVLGVSSKISLTIQMLPEKFSRGRSVSGQPSRLAATLSDPKLAALLHMSVGLLYSSLAAAMQPEDADPWRYNTWATPLLGAAACVGVASSVLIGAVNLWRTCPRAPEVKITELQGDDAQV